MMDDAGSILLLLTRGPSTYATCPSIHGISEAAVDRTPRYTVPHTGHFRQRTHGRARTLYTHTHARSDPLLREFVYTRARRRARIHSCFVPPSRERYREPGEREQGEKREDPRAAARTRAKEQRRAAEPRQVRFSRLTIVVAVLEFLPWKVRNCQQRLSASRDNSSFCRLSLRSVAVSLARRRNDRDLWATMNPKVKEAI